MKLEGHRGLLRSWRVSHKPCKNTLKLFSVSVDRPSIVHRSSVDRPSIVDRPCAHLDLIGAAVRFCSSCIEQLHRNIYVICQVMVTARTTVKQFLADHLATYILTTRANMGRKAILAYRFFQLIQSSVQTRCLRSRPCANLEHWPGPHALGSQSTFHMQRSKTVAQGQKGFVRFCYSSCFTQKSRQAGFEDCGSGMVLSPAHTSKVSCGRRASEN